MATAKNNKKSTALVWTQNRNGNKQAQYRDGSITKGCGAITVRIYRRTFQAKSLTGAKEIIDMCMDVVFRYGQS